MLLMYISLRAINEIFLRHLFAMVISETSSPQQIFTKRDM